LRVGQHSDIKPAGTRKSINQIILSRLFDVGQDYFVKLPNPSFLPDRFVIKEGKKNTKVILFMSKYTTLKATMGA
jgi:hypothetical protein